MEVYQAVILALIQGLTEFLPISSSAHLILPHAVLGWSDQGLAFDVALHVGTLLAVIIYFFKDLSLMIQGLWSLVWHRTLDAQGKLALQIGVSNL